MDTEDEDGGRLVVQALERSAWEYGKVGLLIDDSLECGTRVARALYGSEALPKWWTPVRSMRCACTAFGQVARLLAAPGFGSLRIFILVDRYLPAECGGGGALAWYGGEDAKGNEELIAGMNRLVAEVAAKCDSRILRGWTTDEAACLIRFVTSFPVISSRRGHAGEEQSDIAWQMRSVELLQEERRQLRDSLSWRCLLRFGPETWARIRNDTPPDWIKEGAGAARWRVRTWSKSLKRLAKLFKEERVILITGAGASLSANPLGPGMLPTSEIVYRVSSQIRGGREEPLPRPDPPHCACTPPKPAAAVEWKGDPMPPKDTPLGRLLFGEEREFKLEEICSPKEHEGTPIFADFHRLFRRELYKRDFGFAHHHWLMARLPWTAIVTTNFDGFHERASASVARMLPLDEDARLRVLALGSVRHLTLDGQPVTDTRAGESRLFKPYGSLYSPTGELALGATDIFDFQKHLEAALRVALDSPSRTGALVVVGQSMRDELVKSVLEHLKDDLKGYELLWVDPTSHDRCSQIEDGSTLWERWIAGRMKRRDEEQLQGTWGGAEQANERACSGPFPATTLEFVYDLWSAYQSKDD